MFRLGRWPAKDRTKDCRATSSDFAASLRQFDDQERTKIREEGSQATSHALQPWRKAIFLLLSVPSLERLGLIATPVLPIAQKKMMCVEPVEDG